MVGLNVDVIAVIGAVTVRAVQKATSTIPIVFSVVVEPVGDGLAANLQRPDGNAAGVTTFDPHQAVTQLEFLKMVMFSARDRSNVEAIGAGRAQLGGVSREARRKVLITLVLILYVTDHFDRTAIISAKATRFVSRIECPSAEKACSKVSTSRAIKNAPRPSSARGSSGSLGSPPGG